MLKSRHFYAFPDLCEQNLLSNFPSVKQLTIFMQQSPALEANNCLGSQNIVSF